MKTLIKNLVEAYGPSGQEGPVRAFIEGIISSDVDDIRVDAMGNLIARKSGTGTGTRIMLAAHMDEIGLVVTYADKKGFLRFTRIGGVSPQTLIGNRVRFSNGTTGVIGWEKWFQSTELASWSELYIDVGASSRDDLPVGVGDIAAFDRSFSDLGGRLVGKAMDDRIGCAIMMKAIGEVGQSPNDIHAVFTVQEELGTRGATTSAFGIEPEVALAIDVTLVGDTPEGPPLNVKLGRGPAIKVMDGGMVAHAGVKGWMIETAERHGIAYQLEVLPSGSTDARAIQTSRAGVPAGCLSIPCRYVHTPSEMVDLKDVEETVRLLVALLTDPIVI